MERVNREFVKLNKIDLLYILNEKSSCVNIIKKLLSCIFDYEKVNKSYVGDFYLSVDSLYYVGLSKSFKFPIRRNVLLNSFNYAAYTKDLEMLYRLNPFISKKEVSIESLGSLLNYVLDHSICFDEYLDGEEKKLIFDDNTNGFKQGFIYGDFSKQKRLV